MENRQTLIRENLKDLSSSAQRMFDEAQEKAGHIYDISSDFVRENQTVVMVGAGLLVGVLGFFLGRASKSE